MSPRRSRPAPRDHLVNPARFARYESADWALPTNASVTDHQLARAQHEVCWAVYALADRSAAEQIAQLGGFSIKTWSDYSLGKTWMPTIGFAAVAVYLAHRPCWHPQQISPRPTRRR